MSWSYTVLRLGAKNMITISRPTTYNYVFLSQFMIGRQHCESLYRAAEKIVVVVWIIFLQLCCCVSGRWIECETHWVCQLPRQRAIHRHYNCIWLDIIPVIPRTATVVMWQGCMQVMCREEGWDTVINSLNYSGWDNCRIMMRLWIHNYSVVKL